MRLIDHAYAWPSRDLTDEQESPAFQIVLPRVGLWSKYVRGEELVADVTTAVFYDRRETCRYRHHDSAGRCTHLILSPELMADVCGERASRARFPRTHWTIGASASVLHALLLHRTRAHRETSEDPGELEELCLWLLHSVLDDATDTAGRRVAESRPSQRILARRAAASIQEGFRRKTPLSALAQSLGSSPYHLCRAFAATFGCGPQRYRNRLRLLAALSALGCEPDIPTVDLALDLGFSSRAHFSAAFGREYGLSPSGFRKLLQARSPAVRQELIARLGPAPRRPSAGV